MVQRCMKKGIASHCVDAESKRDPGTDGKSIRTTSPKKRKSVIDNLLLWCSHQDLGRSAHVEKTSHYDYDDINDESAPGISNTWLQFKLSRSQEPDFQGETITQSIQGNVKSFRSLQEAYTALEGQEVSRKDSHDEEKRSCTSSYSRPDSTSVAVGHNTARQ